MRYITPRIIATVPAVSTIKSFKAGPVIDGNDPTQLSAGSAYQADE
jgi:hypothetical protein